MEERTQESPMELPQVEERRRKKQREEEERERRADGLLCAQVTPYHSV
jgi:hypothetical protein